MSLLLTNGKLPQIKYRPTQFQQGGSVSVPSPYGGINLREDITALQPNEARVLENFFPSSGTTQLRPGFAEFGTGMGTGEVKTLAAYSGPSASKLISGANGKLFDVTTKGSATSLKTSLTEDRWQTQCFNGHLFFVNGSDSPVDYDGSTVNTTSWSGTGLTNSNLINVALVRNRMWFCEKDSADVWYGPIGGIQGTLTKFQLSQIASGGYCMAIGSWSRDAGDGADDFTVFVMSTGEILIYQGDPATTFSIQGRYATGAAPVGRQCIFRVGGELIVITRLGLLPVSAAVSAPNNNGTQALDLSQLNPWGKIASDIVSDAKLDGDNPGWHGKVHEGVIYINVPQSTGVLSKQYVLNTRIGSWTTYKGWNGSSFESFGNALYFGAQRGGVVNLVGAADDNGTQITAKANCAFSLPSGPSKTNLFTAIRPKIQANGAVSGLIGVDTDYVIRSLVGDTVDLLADTSTTPWGSPWGSPWGQPNQSQPQWFTIQGQGRAVSVRMTVTSNSQDLEWYATDLLMKPGGIK
jgi:hypothetical protein